jgi:cell division septation protein DedD
VSGSWRVQLGAFSNEANARRQWSKVQRSVAALGSLQPAYTRAGAMTRLRAGDFASRAAADRVCAAVRAAGEACLAVPR